jgi:hypothetical protein
MQTRLITAGALVVVGLIWIGQGSGLLGGSSFMVGDPRWVASGAIVAVVGAILGFIAWRNSRPGA